MAKALAVLSGAISAPVTDSKAAAWIDSAQDINPGVESRPAVETDDLAGDCFRIHVTAGFLVDDHVAGGSADNNSIGHKGALGGPGKGACRRVLEIPAGCVTGCYLDDHGLAGIHHDFHLREILPHQMKCVVFCFHKCFSRFWPQCGQNLIAAFTAFTGSCSGSLPSTMGANRARLPRFEKGSPWELSP